MTKAKIIAAIKYSALLLVLLVTLGSCYQTSPEEQDSGFDQSKEKPYDPYEGVGEIGDPSDAYLYYDEAAVLRAYDEAYAALDWRGRMQVEKGMMIFNGTEFSIVPQFHMSPQSQGISTPQDQEE